MSRTLTVTLPEGSTLTLSVEGARAVVKTLEEHDANWIPDHGEWFRFEDSAVPYIRAGCELEKAHIASINGLEGRFVGIAMNGHAYTFLFHRKDCGKLFKVEPPTFKG